LQRLKRNIKRLRKKWLSGDKSILCAVKKTQKQLDLVAALLRRQSTLSLATAGENGEPCATPLFYFVDEAFSLYWLSSESSLHSLNLAKTPSASATVYGDAKSWREIHGIQMRGQVSLVTDQDRRAVLIKAYCERFKLRQVFRLAIRQSALYAFRPEFFRYIDNARGFGLKFELTRPGEGWSSAQPRA
jgi:uncharacterized protein YhbP (UPF0306 family)